MVHSYPHDRNSLTTCGKGGNQWARNAQRLNFDQMRMPIPPKRKMVAAMVSKLIGKQCLSPLRFHSSLALCFSAGENRVPNKCVEAVSAITPAMLSIAPTSWIK